MTALDVAVEAGARPEPKEQNWIQKQLRRRTFKHYNRLVVVVSLLNLFAAFGMVQVWRVDGDAGWLTARNLLIINLTVAILIRQQYVVNGLFWLATRAPTSWPLSVRWTLGKVYHFGGIHTSAATIATLWFLINLGQMTAALVSPGDSQQISIVAFAMSWALAGVLIAIVWTALPFVRQKKHDRFERVHRWGGWSSLVLFWVTTLLTTPLWSWTVAALALATFSVALPWLRLKKVPVDIETPSSHVALASFDYGHTPFAGSSTALSRSPLKEWHSFANVPIPNEDGFKLTISRAGDWTGSLIDDRPAHVWVKGTCTAGVANIEVLFKKVVYIATGSGIGPCLPHLFAAKVPASLVWATRNPVNTYGQGLVDQIMAAQPDALVWDTDANGKPDMVELAYQRVMATGAEAVICISNPKLTWQVVEGMEQRGVPAYGAIWDS